MKKAIVICTALLLALMGAVPLIPASNVTGTFTATGNLSVVVNDTTPDFGSIGPGDNSVVLFNVTNNGNIPVTVTQEQAAKDSGNLTIGTVEGGLSTNEYSVEIQLHGAGDWYCVGAANKQINASLAVSGVNDYALRVTVSSLLTYEVAEEQFSADILASETS